MQVNTGLSSVMALAVCFALSACTYRVNSFLDAPDEDPGDGDCATAPGSQGAVCTLRAAVMESNANLLPDRIEVPAGQYEIESTLTIEQSVTIQGEGASSTIVEQTGGGNVFLIEGGTVRIGQLTVRGGDSQAGGGLRIEDGEVEIADVEVRDNFGFTGGGGMFVNDDAEVRVYRSTFESNSAQGAFGGAIWNQGQLFVFDSTLSENQSNRAGALHNSGILNLRNVTVSGNEALSPSAGTGGIVQIEFAFLNNVTITGNIGRGNNPASFRGGGLLTTDDATTVVKNSIIDGNIGNGGPNDCAGPLTSDSRYNLIGDTTGCELPGLLTTWQVNVSANLGPLANNGGPTRTHAINSFSPAADNGFPFPPGGPAADSCQGDDQRGVPRPQGSGECDMGAYEFTNHNGRVLGFMIVDADTNTDVRPLRDGDQLFLGELPDNLSIRAVPSHSPTSVRFDFDDISAVQIENVPPFALAGDSPAGNYNAAPFAFTTGDHTVTATPFAQAGAAGAAGIALTATYTVTTQAPN